MHLYGIYYCKNLDKKIISSKIGNNVVDKLAKIYILRPQTL